MKLTTEALAATINDPRYSDIGDLPSQLVPYKGRADKPDLTKLYIRPFEFAELKLLSASIQTQNKRHLVRAVDLVITHDVNDLTIGDFQYVMTWLLLNSFPKRPRTVEWTCSRQVFRNKQTRDLLTYDMEKWPSESVIFADYEPENCNTLNNTLVQLSSFDTKCLDENVPLPEGFDFPRVAILQDTDEALQQPDMAFLVPAAQWMPGDTWEEKVKHLEANFHKMPEALDINKKFEHGIVEQLEIMCRKCRTKHIHAEPADALSFFQ